MQERTSHSGVESRAAARTNLFLAATLTSADVEHPVKIRDLSETGARIDTAFIPEVGATVSLARGHLSAQARVSWHAGRFCGVSFTSPVSITDWMANPVIVEKRPRAAADREAVTAGGAIEDLKHVSRLLKSLSEVLVCDSTIVMKHGVKLQNLNLAMHLLSTLTEAMQAEADEGAEGNARPDGRGP